MARPCTVCSRSYPSHANFCALCGRPLAAARASLAVRNVGFSAAAIVATLTTYVVFAVARPTPVMEERFFNLSHARAGAVFELLRPRDVKVLVRREAGRVEITGTRRECDVLTDFVALITRYHGKSECEVRHYMTQAGEGWTTRRDYKLSKSKANALFDALAPDDVPVLVSRSGKRVRVEATSEDQRTIRHVVEILRGRRL